MNTTDAFLEQILSVRLSPDKKSVDIIDQTLLPGTIKRIFVRTREEMFEAIRTLRVRGAPAIGVFAAYSLAVLAGGFTEGDTEAFLKRLQTDAAYLSSSRPTAVNLSWALERMEKRAEREREKGVKSMREALFAEADEIREEDVAISRSIGEAGYRLIEQHAKSGLPVGILTHCNAGTLATAKYGTATAPMYLALEHGMSGSDLHVYCDETRPLLQGARLTAFELNAAGIRTTLLCDSAASCLMQTGAIDLIFVGCDRVADNGDTANKIGTSSVAILAKHYGIPFYVCAPSSTIDRKTETGADIVIEQREADEVTSLWYKERMTAEGVRVLNPAFDVTEHGLITGIITEKGLCEAPFDKAFDACGIF